MTRVFISYSHDSAEHKARIADLAQRLLGHGIPTTVDTDKLPGGPDEGWPKWSERQVVEHEKVLIACTSRYCISYDTTGQFNGGLGAACEAQAIRQILYDSAGINDKFRVILFDEADLAHIPLSLKGYHRFNLWNDESVQELLAWLHPPAAPAPLAPATIAWPKTIAPHKRGIANRTAEFACFEDMLKGQGETRVLLLHADSSGGKSVLMREFHNRVHAADAAVAHCFVDLKGCRDIDSVLTELAADADGLLSNLAALVPAQRQAALLNDLKNLPAPLVLAFDTYEQCGDEFANWLERQILQRIDRFPALRIVVAGQRVPDAENTVWATHAKSFALKPIDREADWLDFGRANYQNVPEQTLAGFVPDLIRATGGNPAVISSLLKGLAASYGGNGGRP